jgi:hypothetical protein
VHTRTSAPRRARRPGCSRPSTSEGTWRRARPRTALFGHRKCQREIDRTMRVFGYLPPLPPLCPARLPARRPSVTTDDEHNVIEASDHCRLLPHAHRLDRFALPSERTERRQVRVAGPFADVRPVFLLHVALDLARGQDLARSLTWGGSERQRGRRADEQGGRRPREATSNERRRRRSARSSRPGRSRSERPLSSRARRRCRQ